MDSLCLAWMLHEERDFIGWGWRQRCQICPVVGIQGKKVKIRGRPYSAFKGVQAQIRFALEGLAVEVPWRNERSFLLSILDW